MRIPRDPHNAARVHHGKEPVAASNHAHLHVNVHIARPIEARPGDARQCPNITLSATESKLTVTVVTAHACRHFLRQHSQRSVPARKHLLCVAAATVPARFCRQAEKCVPGAPGIFGF